MTHSNTLALNISATLSPCLSNDDTLPWRSFERIRTEDNIGYPELNFICLSIWLQFLSLFLHFPATSFNVSATLSPVLSNDDTLPWRSFERIRTEDNIGYPELNFICLSISLLASSLPL